MSSSNKVVNKYILRSGIDLVEISRLQGLKPGIRARFLARVFTPAELTEAGTSDASLMGRFAAKEAVAKALGNGIGEISWKEIEISVDEAGAPRVRLHGRARELAGNLHLGLWSVSISHTHTHAVAVAVALGFPNNG